MKNRRFLVVAFLLVAAMVIGVGYAAISQQLKFTGSINILSDSAQEQFKDDVYFAKEYAASAKSSGKDLSTEEAKTKNPATPGSDEKPLSFDLAVNTLALSGDTVTYTFTIKNESSHTVQVTFDTLRIREQIMNDSQGEFSNNEVTVTWKYEWENHVDGQPQVGLIAKNGEVKLTITITLKQNPNVDKVASIYGLLTATAID